MKVALAFTVLIGAFVLAWGSSAAAVAPCTAAQLTGTFKVIPGSAGAGNIVYRLRLRNHSAKPCVVSGVAGLRLLSKTGKPLPTKVTRARPGLGLALILLRPGKAARADGRFTPDVPGPGEPVDRRQCEPTAYKVRVTVPPSGGKLVAPVLPATPVCVHGRISLTSLSAA